MESVNQEEGIDPKKKDKKAGRKLIQMERTRTAFERLQLAWIRTSLTMLMIGVGAYEFFYNRLEAGKAPLLGMRYLSGRELGLFFMITSFVMLLLATLQHTSSMATLKKYFPQSRYSIALLLSYLLLALISFLSLMVAIKL